MLHSDGDAAFHIWKIRCLMGKLLELADKEIVKLSTTTTSRKSIKLFLDVTWQWMFYIIAMSDTRQFISMW